MLNSLCRVLGEDRVLAAVMWLLCGAIFAFRVYAL